MDKDFIKYSIRERLGGENEIRWNNACKRYALGHAHRMRFCWRLSYWEYVCPRTLQLQL